jgi:hypothetical protein
VIDAADHLSAVGSQTDMDLECDFARAMGLRYWAFCMYREGSSLNSGWYLYQNSRNQQLINWCGITTAETFGCVPFAGNSAWLTKVDKWITYFQQPSYQLVENGRPLFYLLWDDRDIDNYFDGRIENLSLVLNYLREQCHLLHGRNPYIVIMNGRPKRAASLMKTVSADAIGGYIPNLGRPPSGAVAWSELEKRVEDSWVDLAGQSVDCVPTALTGWDERARRDHPESFAVANVNEGLNDFFALPTDDELKAHLSSAVSFVRRHPVACPSRALLIYSWNEDDEGGNPLIPTIGKPPNTDRFRLLRDALR